MQRPAADGLRTPKAEIQPEILSTFLPIWQLRQKIQTLPRRIALTPDTRAYINTLAMKVSSEESLHK
jgi:hypothetical protein